MRARWASSTLQRSTTPREGWREAQLLCGNAAANGQQNKQGQCCCSLDQVPSCSSKSESLLLVTFPSFLPIPSALSFICFSLLFWSTLSVFPNTQATFISPSSETIQQVGMASIYEAGPSSSSSMYSGHRIPPANGSLNYQRPSPLSRRRSPSPPPYHRYSPRQSPVYDSHYYQRQPPPAWSERGAYDSQSSTPDRYAHDKREPRPRSDSWNSHSDSRWESGSSGRKDTAISTPRLFEPSDSWKKTHDNRNVQPASYNPRRSPERPLPSSPRADRRRVSDGYYRRPQALSDDLPARYDSYRPTYDENSSSAASSRAQSIGRRRSSPPLRGRPWPSKSRSPGPRRRSYSNSRSSSRRRSSSRSRPSSPRPRTISRLPRRPGSPSPVLIEGVQHVLFLALLP
ncbi:hypothetical protein BDZ89DRAFT_19520 [Hymenopellis radicata]|nr:hypothetical protein BDZ89DRAFT_19520 [Hymenopellis radicata]